MKKKSQKSLHWNGTLLTTWLLHISIHGDFNVGCLNFTANFWLALFWYSISIIIGTVKYVSNLLIIRCLADQVFAREIQLFLRCFRSCFIWLLVIIFFNAWVAAGAKFMQYLSGNGVKLSNRKQNKEENNDKLQSNISDLGCFWHIKGLEKKTTKEIMVKFIHLLTVLAIIWSYFENLLLYIKVEEY